MKKIILTILITVFLTQISVAIDSSKVPVSGTFTWYDSALTPDSAFITIKDTSSTLIDYVEINWDTHFWDTTFTLVSVSDWVYINAVWFRSGDSITESYRFDVVKQSYISDGIGPYVWTVVAYDTVNSAAVPSVEIIFYDSANPTDERDWGITLSSGILTKNMIEGAYIVVPWVYQFDFAPNDTIRIDSNRTDTVKCAPLDLDDPTLEATCAVYGFATRADGTKSGIQIRATINRRGVMLTRTSTVISPAYATDTTDNNGRWDLNLFMTDSLSPKTPWYFELLDSLGEPIKKKSKYIPKDSTQWYFTW